MVYRPAISIIQHFYGVVVEHGRRVDALSDFERQELFYLAAVLPLLGADLGVAPSPVALCTDACESGYAIRWSCATAAECFSLTAVRECWRFRPARPAAPRHLATQDAEHGAADGAFDQWARDQVTDADGAFDQWARDQVTEAQLADAAADADRAPLAAAAQLLDRTDPCSAAFVVAQAVQGQLGYDIGADALFGNESVPQAPDCIAADCRWRRATVGVGRGPDLTHNLDAAVAADRLVSMVRRADVAGTELFSLGSNMSEQLSTECECARHRALHCPRRHAAAWQLAAGIVWRRRLVASMRNLSDADSRLALDRRLAPGQWVHGTRLDAYLEARRSLPRRHWPRAPPGNATLEVLSGGSRLTARLL